MHLKIGQPIYIRELLTFKNLETSVNLRNTDRQHLEEPFLSRLYLFGDASHTQLYGRKTH